ncbi:hypothetical protein CPB83DRAFT_905483 [Crepidotus variabilis]|uniref:F-box domain-containing protein n=1 Tax=Crepidotus variabilis TaxID=179855 RepID=A0A9P6JS60_9AGAR|nr:hypothetical protein CPB83DRAFT_905483 [Crepidotus variabilis]
MVLDYPRIFRLLESLPIELIAEIFRHAITAWSPNTIPNALAEIEHEFTALHLGAVCRSWRALVWHTPTLWSGVRVCATPKQIATQVVLLDEWLSRSGSLPLDITLCSPDNVDWLKAGDHSKLQSLIMTTNRYASRWRSLVLQIPGYSCGALPKPHVQLPFLERLRIDPMDNGPNDRFSLQGATALRRLDLNLRSVYLATIDIPLSNITHLNLDYCILAEFLFLLPHCPLLTDIVVENLRPDVGISVHSLFDIPELPLVLLSVQALTLRNPHSLEVNSLLASIVTPELKEFTYDGLLPPRDLTPFCAFLSRCPTLQEFSLFDRERSPRRIVQILEELKTIKTFKLDVSNRDENLPLNDQLLNMLHPSPGAQYLLPKLENFTFIGGLGFTWPRFIAAWKARINVKGFGEAEWTSWKFTIISNDKNPLADESFMEELKSLQCEADGRLKLSFRTPAEAKMQNVILL